MDFTVKIYNSLLDEMVSKGYLFDTFANYLINKDGYPQKSKLVMLRHDVDLLPFNSLRFAQLQASKGIKGSYYFRAVPESWNIEVIKQIADLGHEVGYHYETMDTANGNIEKAWDQFRFHLDELRSLVDVKTICMHGSPRSKFDNKEIWSKFDYRSLDIIGEPYYDVNFDEVFYLTDTGRRWDGWKSSVRDKVPQQTEWAQQGLVFHSTNDVIQAFNANQLPDNIMFTMHPQRWSDGGFPWLKELILQNLKNEIKKYLVK